MDSERLKRIEEIYHAALEVRSGEREEFLRNLCGGDTQLHREVESLLAFEDTFDSFIDTPPASLAAEVLSEEETDFTGERLAHFRIVSRIGRGGMGTVYLAMDTNLDRNVAIKFLDRTFNQFPEHLHRFTLEAKSASALNHPNIITIYEIGTYRDTHFIAAELIEGETLRQRMQDNAPSLNFVLETAVQIASALNAAHSAGIVHRDIKPDNIMIRPDGLVKVLDFGIAKLTTEFRADATAPRRAGKDDRTLILQSQTQSGTLIGTTNYMSPEQVRGKVVTPQTDIFSFGVVLYEMLTGKLPFEGETHSDVMAAILTEKPESLNKTTRQMPDGLERIIEKALRKDKAKRYETAGEMLEDLQKLKKKIDLDRELERSLESEGALSVETRLLRSVNTNRTKTSRSAIAGRVFSRAGPPALLALLLIILAGFGFWLYSNAGPEQIETIAVMPFKNNTGSAENEYLSDGIAESLIQTLSQIPQISVKARSSVFRYKGKEFDPQKIGGELAVQALLIGRIDRQGELLSIDLELVDAKTGNRIWGEKYRRDSSDLTSLESELARDVLSELKTQLSLSDKQKISKNHTDSNEAYRHYLKGRYFWNKRTAANFRKAIEEFRAAIDKDPNYALPYVGLADSYVLMENFAGTPSIETLPLAKAYAKRALAIDDSLPEAHASLALVLHRSWQWSEAENAYRRSIELNPNYASAHHWYSLLLRETGRLDESLAAAERAQRLDPLSGIIIGNLGLAFIASGDANSAVAQMEKLIELDPGFPWGYSILGLAYIEKGNFDEAVFQTKKGSNLAKNSSNALSIFGYANAVAGRREEALAVIKELEEKYAQHKALGRNIARVYSGLGKNDKAFEWLEKDLENRSSFLPYIIWFPSFEPLRGDPRYKHLLERMDIPGHAISR